GMLLLKENPVPGAEVEVTTCAVLPLPVVGVVDEPAVCWSTLSSRSKKRDDNTLPVLVTTQGRPKGPTATDTGVCPGTGMNSNCAAAALKRRNSLLKVTMNTEPSGPMEMFFASRPTCSQGIAGQRSTVPSLARPQSVPSGARA